MTNPTDYRAVEAASKEGVHLDTNKPACSTVGDGATAILTILVRSAAELAPEAAVCDGTESFVADDDVDGTQALTTASVRVRYLPLSARANSLLREDNNGSESEVFIDQELVLAPLQQLAQLDKVRAMLPVLGPLADAVFAWASDLSLQDRVLQILQLICILPACPYAIAESTSLRHLKGLGAGLLMPSQRQLASTTRKRLRRSQPPYVLVAGGKEAWQRALIDHVPLSHLISAATIPGGSSSALRFRLLPVVDAFRAAFGLPDLLSAQQPGRSLSTDRHGSIPVRLQRGDGTAPASPPGGSVQTCYTRIPPISTLLLPSPPLPQSGLVLGLGPILGPILGPLNLQRGCQVQTSQVYAPHLAAPVTSRHRSTRIAASSQPHVFDPEAASHFANMTPLPPASSSRGMDLSAAHSSSTPSTSVSGQPASLTTTPLGFREPSDPMTHSIVQDTSTSHDVSNETRHTAGVQRRQTEASNSLDGLQRHVSASQPRQLIQSGIRTGRWVVQRITSSLRSAWEQPQSAGATDGARATRGGTAAINSRIPRISAGTQVQPPAARNILQGPGNEWRGHLPEGLFQVVGNDSTGCGLTMLLRPSKHRGGANATVAFLGSSRSAVMLLDQFLCPITHATMVDPVVAADGHLYESCAITKWLSIARASSPMTNMPMKNLVLTPCQEARHAIAALQKAADGL